MEHHICLISSWLKDGSTHPADILTIYGMGGIGKTSLAKLIYSLYRCQFQRSSFIEDINRNSKKLLSFQKQLCANISRTSSVEVSDISAYTCTIEKVLSSKKVLLVLDDVDDLDQLKNLLGNKGFHNGSKIIITSRDASLTKKLKLDVQPKRTMCLLEGLSFESSLELFSLHAFTCNSVKKGYEEMTKKLVNYCDGHPQALIVMGRNLWDRSQAAWKEYIDGLNEETDSRIRKQLQMSFESLQNNDKELFMHIACFFAGKDRVFAETILHECDIGTLNGIKNLVDRCLLTIGPRNELKMHQLLQDMGKDFVRKEHLRPWRRSRIWSHKEFFEVLRKKKDKGTLKGIILDCSVGGEDTTHGSLEVEMDVLRTMDSLDLLQLNHVKFKGSYNFPKNLRWLCIHGFPSRSLPSDLPMGNLVVLDMTNSKIESFDLSNSVKSFQWLAGKKTKLLGSCSKDEWSLGSLKILNLSFCYQLRSLQDFSKLPALERLILAGCRSLVEISKSIDKCTELVVVDLSYCIMLKKLPTTLSNLKNLEALSLDGCNLDKSSLEDLQKIINLNTSLQASSSDTKVPHVMSSKICLATSLNYKPSECDSWREESYPMACSSLAMSDALTLDGNPIVILPNGVRSLRRIELLSYEEHDMLKKIKHPTCTRRNLKFSRWDLLTNLYDPNVSPITKALSIYLEAQSLPEIKGVVQLQPIADVEDLIYGLDWKDFDLIKNKKLLFEFGIFSTFYGGKEMPKWIRDRNNGPSINFIVPSSSKNLRGLNFCYLQTGRDPDNGVNLPTVKVRNETKNCTWIYKQYIHWVKVDEKCLIWLSHWMFGKKEMENGDHITISIPPEDNVSIRECGISFVYDDGTMQEDVLGDYKKWDHIIGRDLSPFCLTTKEYFLDNHRFFWWHIDCPVNRPFIKNGACYEGCSF
uniref:disease resistance protein RPV1-like n=1 Tax=Erigeron canadensis TaxID=72917 RepID=UPI001CB9B56A|nr:disease resistance protein RPV1-like [Erigeron canadensis]